MVKYGENYGENKVKYGGHMYKYMCDFAFFSWNDLNIFFEKPWEKEVEHLPYFADGFPMKHWDFTLQGLFAGVVWWNVGSNAVHESSR